MTHTSSHTLATHRPWRWLGALLLLAALHPAQAQQAYGNTVQADPPGRVARLSLAEGSVAFAPAEAADANGAIPTNAWAAAELNRPLTAGDRLWSGPASRSEMHIGSTALRMAEQTGLDFTALDDNIAQMQLAQGTLQLRVRALYDGQRLEIDTPNLAFLITAPGDYRIDVSPAAGVTRVVAQAGAGVLYGDNGVQLPLAAGQQASFTGTTLVPAQPGASTFDAFDQWAADRDRREDQSVSARYVPRETIGYQQLDNYGDWRQDVTYGAVWLPRALPANWAPYSAGQWRWIAPWGWTWVDDAPWGFAPSHYGRWAQIGGRWAWAPGRLAPRPVYAPALVAFIGPQPGRIQPGGRPGPGVGWFPLAPGEAFRPDYRASPRYVLRLNNNLVQPDTNRFVPTYRYQRQPGAVTAISRDDFMQGRPVRGPQNFLGAAELGRAQWQPGHGALPPRPVAASAAGAPGRPPLPAAELPPPALTARPPRMPGDARGMLGPRPQQPAPASPAVQQPAPQAQAPSLTPPTTRDRVMQAQPQQGLMQQQQQRLLEQQRRQNEERAGAQREQQDRARQQQVQQQQQQAQQQQQQAQQTQRAQQEAERHQAEQAANQQRAQHQQAQQQQQEREQQQQQQAQKQQQQAHDQQARAAQQQAQQQRHQQERAQQEQARQAQAAQRGAEPRQPPSGNRDAEKRDNRRPDAPGGNRKPPGAGEAP